MRKFTRKSVRTEKQIEARQQRQQHKMLHIILAWKQTTIIIITICELHLRVQCTKCCNFRTATAAAMTNRVYSLPATLLLSHSLLLLFYYSCCKICTFLHQLQIYLPKNESTVRQSQSQRQSPTESGHLHRSDGNFPRGVCVIVVANYALPKIELQALHAWETSSKMEHSNCRCLTNVSTLTPDNDDGIVVSRWGNFALTSLPKKSHALSHLS